VNTATNTDTSALLRATRARRERVLRTGRRRSVALAASVVGTWALLVTQTSQWGRVADNLAAALTMVFGSFVAGSTPQGGGAVAFPVFTKVLGVAAVDAKTFSLCVQAVGMGSASVIIAMTRRPVDRGALRLTVPSAIAGFGIGSLLFSVVTPAAAQVKVIFTLVVVAAGVSTLLSRRARVVQQRTAAPLESRSMQACLVAVAMCGGVASALFGSGADIAVYLMLTIVLGVRPSIGVATSVVTMAAVSVVGFLTALATGAISVTQPLGGTDLFGMWLAAVPVVVVGAPVGSWFASRVSPAALARFIGALAAAELVSTVVFLEELRSDPVVASFALAGFALMVVSVVRIAVLRERLAARAAPPHASVRRLDVELAGAP
jgi:uncharacterized membrane protein YfcA